MGGGAKRILVYGVTGSGKSTLAAKISERTGIPWYSVDDLAWEPNWVQVPAELQRERIAEICAREEWILDTAYAAWIDVPMARVQLILCLDYPRWLSFWRLVRRTVSRIADRKPICNGNIETLRGALAKDSILLWHFKSFTRKRQRIRAWVADPCGPPAIAFRSEKEARAWLESAWLD